MDKAILFVKNSVGEFFFQSFSNEFVINIIEGKVLDKRGWGSLKRLEDINHRMLIRKHCDLKLAASDRGEWLPIEI